MIGAMAGYGVPAVGDVGGLLMEMLERAQVVKQTTTVEPPLHKSDIAELFLRFESKFPEGSSSESKKHIIETAVRDIFNNLLASTNIEERAFVKLWNLLDIVSILSDDEQTEPGLLFWLVEELLDSQTIAGCRKIFDYLESRRERITAKHFASKNLVILRSCNELLRRLSRAEDTAFCGRVFIFLFQSFPLGDKSSVNLRGEYHTENVTTYDDLTPEESMDLDPESNSIVTIAKEEANGSTKKAAEDSTTKGVSFSKPEAPLDADKLYPIFWSLQRSFAQPKNLFDATNFSGFKAGLEVTMTMFKSVQSENPGRSTKVMEDTKRGTKRKRGQGDDDLANAFNPKYLTSRDLFELEISDLSFRRHILVQALIVLDFLLSLSAKAKEKLASSTLPANPNKSVMYADQVLNEDDTKWASDFKKIIAEYLRQGSDGPFFYRMVENVLSRDKNWARWKIDNCPSIARGSLSAQEYAEAKTQARRATMNKKLRSHPMGSFDLKFLSEGHRSGGLDRLKNPSRYKLPEVKTFKSKIEEDQFDIEMAKDEEAKNAAIELKASKSWRALRIASTTKLGSFDKIEASDKIDEIFLEQVIPEEPVPNGVEELADSEEVVFPDDRRPIILSGPGCVGKSAVIKKLLEKYPKTFEKEISYIVRTVGSGEAKGQHYHFISKEEFDVMRDGDQFLQFDESVGTGTSRKAVEAIIARNKVPILEMDPQGVQQMKDNGYTARYICVAPPNFSELEKRMRESKPSIEEEKIKEGIEIAQTVLMQADEEGFYDNIFVNDDVDATVEKIASYIFGTDEVKAGEDQEMVVEEPAMTTTEVDIVDIKTLPPAQSEEIDMPTEDGTVSSA